MPTPARHILTYARTLEGGGVERATLRLAKGWIGSGRRVTLVVGDPAGPLAAEIPDGLEIVSLGTPAYRSLMRAVPGVVARLAPDIVFCAGNYYTGVAAWTKLRLGRACPPIVGKMSNAVDRGDHGAPMRLAHGVWLSTHGRFLDHLVAMTPATARVAADALRMVGRVSVIPNPPASLSGGASRARPAGRYVLGVGRLEPQKRWDHLIAAFAALADHDVALVIFGEGSQRAVLEAQVHALGLDGRVLLPGHTADPLDAMAGATILALTSDFEGVPGVLREALSMATPVVATDSSPAVAEIVNSPLLGTIVPRDDATALVAALEHWLAPDAIRPVAVPQPGLDSAARYLALFDLLSGK